MRHQCCWVHKTSNVLNKLPKSAQPKAKKAFHEIWMAETKKIAEASFDLSVKSYEDKYPGIVQCLLKAQELLLVLYDFPAAHRMSIRTTNFIESTFATLAHRTKRSKGCLSGSGMLHTMFNRGRLGLASVHRNAGID